MFSNEVLHELKFWLHSKAFYFYATVFTTLSFLIFAGSFGLFDPQPKEVQLKAWINSPSSLNYIILYLQKMMMVLLPTIVGVSLYKDYKKQAHSIIYSYPINKAHYLIGRFSASILLLIGINLLVILALLIVENLEGLNSNLQGPIRPYAYLQTFFIYVLPNWIAFGLITYAVIMSSRKIMAAYLIIIVPFLVQLISENAFTGNDYLIALFDPFGQNVAAYYQKDWDIITQNSASLPISGLLLLNRALWLGLAIIVFLISYSRFAFVENIENQFLHFKLFSVNRVKSLNRNSRSEKVKISLDYSILLYSKVIWKTTIVSFKYVVQNLIFWIICSLALMAVVFLMLRVTKLEDFTLVPATQFIIGTPLLIYSMTIVLVTFVFSGLLIHREEQSNMDQLLEAQAMPYSLFFVGKFKALVWMQFLMLSLFILAGIAFQLVSAYSEIDLSLYIYSVYIQTFIPLTTWIFLSISIHVLIRNLYMGIFVLVLGWIGVQGLSSLGINSYLLRFNELPALLYSEFNGFGFTESAYFIVAIYWFSFGLILFLITLRIYRMSHLLSFREHIKSFSSNLNAKSLLIFCLPSILMISLGFKIYKAESVDNSANNEKKEFEKFQDQFEPFRKLTQPKIISLNATIEIYPENQSFECRGQYNLVNTSNRIIDTLLVKTGFDEITELSLDNDYDVILTNDYMKVSLIKLMEKIEPGDTLLMSFHIKNNSNSLFRRNSNVFSNGTFLKQDIFPRFGYSFSEEMPEPSSPDAKERHYQSHDSDKVSLDIKIGTSKNQIAIAPGTLVNKWQENNRQYFHYQCSPVKFSFGINSANYEIMNLERGGRRLEIYYLHDRMLNSMTDGLFASIKLGESLFSSYDWEVARIIEFPISEGTYATAYANNLLISEARFLANTNENNGKVDIAFYVAAHETMHHWWGNKLMPSYAKGATMLTESITEYLMLRILEENQGVEMGRTFYDLQKRRYQNGKKNLTAEEPPLALVEPEQQFISYGKGAVQLFDFSEKIGKDRFHRLLSEFIKESEGTYPTSLDFIDFLNRKLPKYDSLIKNTFFNINSSI